MEAVLQQSPEPGTDTSKKSPFGVQIMNDVKFVISVDMREQRSGVTRQLERSSIVTVKYADLAVGDYVLSDEVVVERKEATDFVLSIMDRRLFGQVAQMKASSG